MPHIAGRLCCTSSGWSSSIDAGIHDTADSAVTKPVAYNTISRWSTPLYGTNTAIRDTAIATRTSSRAANTTKRNSTTDTDDTTLQSANTAIRYTAVDDRKPINHDAAG